MAGTGPEDTFVLGVGSQKCGTAWLYHYLRDQKNANLGVMKEYHIWDVLYTPGVTGERLRRKQSFKQRMVRDLMFANRRFYFWYFRHLLKRDGIELTADITPSYSGLKREAFSQIREGFERRGIQCKVVFLMRDPAERCISALSMYLRNGDRVIEGDATSALLQHAKSRSAELRTNYQRTVAELEAVFDPGQIHYGIYEEMFRPEEITRLADFLNIPPAPERADVRVNASPRPAYDPAVRKEIVEHYRATYEFAASRFPQVKELWQGFAYL